MRWLRFCKLSLYANEYRDEHAGYFRRWLKSRAVFITFLRFGNDVISLELRPLIFVHLYTRTQTIQKQVVEHGMKRQYPKKYLAVDKVGRKKFLARKSCLVWN